jgi:hypothetical protein
VQVKLLPANELGLRVSTPCEVVSSEASSASERKKTNQNQYHCLATGQKYYSTCNRANATFVSKVSQLKFSLVKVTGKRPLVTKISKAWECPRISGNKQPLADYWT